MPERPRATAQPELQDSPKAAVPDGSTAAVLDGIIFKKNFFRWTLMPGIFSGPPAGLPERSHAGGGAGVQHHPPSAVQPGAATGAVTAVPDCPPAAVPVRPAAAVLFGAAPAVQPGAEAAVPIRAQPAGEAGVQEHPEAAVQQRSEAGVHDSAKVKKLISPHRESV